MDESHNHSHHSHDHSHSLSVAQVSNRAFRIGITLNLAYVIIELVAGFLTHSLALITDAGHNFGDVLGLFLALLSFQLANWKPTEKFTYGYKKSTIIAALANATILLIGIGIIGYESVGRIMHPAPLPGITVALVALGGIFINAISAWLFQKSRKNELNARAAYLHLMADAVISAGVVVAGVIIYFSGWYWLDPVISIVILIVILISTWKLLAESLQLSLDAVPKGIQVQKVKEIMEKNKGILNVRHIHVWAMSTTENALTAHLCVEEGLSENEKRVLLNKVKHDLLHCDIHHATIEIETPSDIYEPSCDDDAHLRD